MCKVTECDYRSYLRDVCIVTIFDYMYIVTKVT